jgi:hypothetical protein
VGVRLEAMRRVLRHLRERGRDEEAAELETKIAEIGPFATGQVVLDEAESAARIA